MPCIGQENIYKDANYEVGQIWTYDTRDGEDSSTVTIVAIENTKKHGVIISVFIDGLDIKNPGVEGGINKQIKHLAFSKDAINSSVVKLKQKTEALPDYSEEYEKWHRDFIAGKAPFFDITVKDAVQQLEDAVNPDIKKIKAR